MSEPSFLTQTRAGYDAFVPTYLEMAVGEMERQPFDRAMLTAFADLVRSAVADGVTGASGGHRVAEVGCGPGRISAYLADLGLDMFGIDLSPAMVEHARTAYPQLTFDVASMLSLDWPEGDLAGLVAWYSVIHIPPAERPALFADFHRFLAPGGHLVMAFQAGDDVLIHDFHGAEVHFHRLQPETIAAQLTEAGFTMVASLRRAPNNEKTDQGYLIARKPA
ncbi:MAG: class I SAM-dependent methyltransferase [Hamadaea sp.]|nr:class I SAM-dependent methyltransferase [Hamadaea sp.]